MERNTKKLARRQLIDWKRAAKQNNNKCYITGSTTNLEVHHLGKPFSEIFNEAHEKLGIAYHVNTKDYAPEDLNALMNEVVNAHKDVTALVLESSIHKALHDQYGLDFTMEQVNEFRAAYINSKTDRNTNSK